MPASYQTPPSFGELVHGTDAATEIYPRTPAGPAPSAWSETVATEGIRPPVRETADSAAVHAEPERVVARFRSHGRALFFPTVFVIALAGATGYFAGWFAIEWQNWAVLAGAAVLSVLFFFAPLVRWLSTRYVITTRRIIFRRGLVINTRSELLMGRAHELTVRKSLLQSMFRCGDVRIGTGPGEFVVLKDVPQADLVLTVLGDLLETQHVPAHSTVRFRRTQADIPWWEDPALAQRE
ncbi:PH domain-containing protein [Agreia sp. COWG]|uniref:PH domain-containing protein n=1 Tax=Agreia sp. COWG TaxID=2773266 RepID=UPI00192673A8|nr:PH domain-containing protein [Agreia sp. COWG]CAD5993076.1 bPH_2 domain-containing protein [Agreia sp. COWG]